jgi:hypothetical protein
MQRLYGILPLGRRSDLRARHFAFPVLSGSDAGLHFPGAFFILFHYILRLLKLVRSMAIPGCTKTIRMVLECGREDFTRRHGLSV